MDTISVWGSYGTMTVNATDGTVIAYAPQDTEDGDYYDIVKVDLAEWKHHHKMDKIDPTLDILDVGFWTNKGYYEEAVGMHRKIMREGV